jgi:hypothetical protein
VSIVGFIRYFTRYFTPMIQLMHYFRSIR